MCRLLEEVKIAKPIAPAARTVGATNGTGIDTSGFDNLSAVVDVGAIGNTGTDTTLAVKLQESDDDGSADAYADIAGAAIVGLVHTGDNASPSIDVRLGGRANRKKYVRPVATVASRWPRWRAGGDSGGPVATVAGSDSVLFGVLFLLSRPKQLPVTNSPARKPAP